MTSPITPNPGIHKNPAQASARQLLGPAQSGALTKAWEAAVWAQVEASFNQFTAELQHNWVNFQRLMNDLLITADIFHLIYPVGTPTDPPGTTSGGKPTWYGAWNDTLALTAPVNTTTAPTDPPHAAAALGTMQNTVTALSSQVQTIQTTQGGQAQSNSAYAINFSNYPDGAWPSSDFPVTYTGTGTSTLAISGGNAVMQPGTGGNVTAISHYVNPSNTDYQVLSATISGLPQGNAHTYACVHMNSAMDTYVYAGITLSGFSLNWEIGCFVSGTQHVFATGSGAPLNFSFELRAGVGGNPYRFQGVSGNTIVFDYTDSGHVSTVGSSNRYFGFKSITDNNGAYVPAPASYLGCFDNSPPATQGSGFRMSCSSTTPQSISVGTNTSPPGGSPAWGYFPTGFFDTTDNITSDITPGVSSGIDYVTIGTEGWYLFELRCQQNAVSGSGVVSIYAGYLRNGTFEQLANGASVAVNVLGTQWAPTAFGGNCPIYCKAGDQITPIVYVDETGGGSFLSGLSVFGEVNNRLTYWSLTRMFGFSR